MANRIKVGLISTTIAAVAPMVEEFRRAMPEADLIHFIDEGLVVEAISSLQCPGSNRPRTSQSLARKPSWVKLYSSTSRTSLSPALAELTAFTGVPLVGIDAEMAMQACMLGHTIAIVASPPSVLTSVLPTFAKAASAVGRRPELVPVVLTEIPALPLDSPEASRAIAWGVQEALSQADLAVVGQCSMVGCMAYLPEEAAGRVLIAPPYAVRAVKRLAQGWSDEREEPLRKPKDPREP